MTDAGSVTAGNAAQEGLDAPEGHSSGALENLSAVHGHAEAIPPATIARSFGHAAASYDQHAELQRQVADTLIGMLENNQRHSTILDLGCGTGYCTSALGRLYPAATLLALDLAMPMLESLSARKLEASLLCGNAEALPLQAAQFDLVLSSLTIQWCADPARLFAELWRVMRPGGQVLLSTFGPATLQQLRDAWAGVDDRVHVNAFIAAQHLKQMAGDAGFDVAARSENRQRHYASLRALARELKGVGAHNMNRGRAPGLTSRATFLQAERAFAQGLVPALGIPVTWQVLYLDLRKP